VAELRTFVFSDLVGSVDLKSEMPGTSDADRDAAFLSQILSPHRDRVEMFASDFGGRVVSTAGDGHFLVFSDAPSAAKWAMEVVRIHQEDPISTPQGTIAQVRISMHLGSPQIDPRDENNFIGKAVDYAARLNDFSASAQILVSNAARAILSDAGLNGVRFHSHGKRELKGIGSVEVHELLFDDRQAKDTRHTPKKEKPREWTMHTGTIAYSKLKGLLPDGVAPTSTTQATQETKLGNYELGDLVGAGGMGDVFKAKHSQFGRQRAVKVIKPHLVAAGQQDVVKRFYQEIKAIGGLEHPNIVVAIDSSAPEDSTHFLVMEYVDGSSAGDLVDRFGPMSIANACEIARQTALGLEYISQQGMVHRDIKPSNLMVTTVATPHLLSTGAADVTGDQPLVKILDLGLALLVGDDHERLTRLDHRAMGTAMYMSPEQWKTTSVDIRSDIYSLGCTLYHLLSGKPPFYDSELRPEKAHEKGKLPPIRGGKQISKPLWNIIRKTLSKDPNERFQTPGELAEALAPLAVGNTLVDVVEESRVRPTNQPTLPGHASDTMGANTAHSDTHLAGPRPGSTLTATPVATRRWLWGLAAAVVAAVAAGGWFADLASRRAEEARTAKREALITSAESRASLVAREIDKRWQILKTAAEANNVQEMLNTTVASPTNEELWRPLQDWILKESARHDDETPAESWFVVRNDGVQVARASESDSIGKNYAYRDYFHGQGADLAKGSTNVEPVVIPTQSAVYRSTSTNKLKVAFSVPIWNGLRTEEAKEVAGVLAMSVDLGDFAVLEEKRQTDRQVLLVDLRADYIDDGKENRGLILHHPDLDPKLVKRLPEALLKKIDLALSQNEHILGRYSDPLGENVNQYWGAIQPVVIRRRNAADIDTHWLVMVQEKL